MLMQNNIVLYLMSFIVSQEFLIIKNLLNLSSTSSLLINVTVTTLCKFLSIFKINPTVSPFMEINIAWIIL